MTSNDINKSVLYVKISTTRNHPCMIIIVQESILFLMSHVGYFPSPYSGTSPMGNGAGGAVLQLPDCIVYLGSEW